MYICHFLAITELVLVCQSESLSSPFFGSLLYSWIPFHVFLYSVTYSSQGSHIGQLDFCNWLADGSTADNVISITLRRQLMSNPKYCILNSVYIIRPPHWRRVRVSYYWPWGSGLNSRHYHNFKCGLGLERGHPASWGKLGSYLIEKQRIWLRKSTLLDNGA